MGQGEVLDSTGNRFSVWPLRGLGLQLAREEGVGLGTPPGDLAAACMPLLLAAQ